MSAICHITTLADYPIREFSYSPLYFVFQITRLKIDSNPFAKGFRDSSRLTEFERETMESMLSEQHLLRSPLLEAAGNLSLEERALLAARSQLFLRAAAAAVAGGPYGSAAATGAAAVCSLPSPSPYHPAAAAASLAHHRYSPYTIPLHNHLHKSPASSPDSARDLEDSSPQSKTPPH
ncbi:hypothetical protein AAG570_001788 [Ranatra chinensis]|uniref:T-box domain-containing protein n=1 Tax=Ranatra chinensis TaxID=642074 RepID=A0ABD0YS42_9HEMI